MLDLAFIREHPDKIKQVCQNKNVKVDVDQLLRFDEQRRQLQQQIDQLRAQKNDLSEISQGQKPTVAAVEKSKDLKRQLDDLEPKLTEIEGQFQVLLTQLPNIYSDDTPIGKDESANQVLRRWGDKARFDFDPKPHWELATKLGFIDAERAAKVSGSRFLYLRGTLVKLQFALWQFALATLTDIEKLKKIIAQANLETSAVPFEPILVPVMVRGEVFAKTGRRDPVEDKYYLEADDLFLAGSAEHTLAPMHMNEVLHQEQLPLRYLGYSTAFRREAGSYGQDVRGMLRLHQFDKWELFSITTPESGEVEQNFIVAIQEYLMQQLEIPYQVMAICTGDMGKPDYRQVDIEAWMPGQDQYRETHTSDWNSDFQARRLNIKYQAPNGKELTHTNDATVFSQRPLAAIIENYQTSAGQIKVPKVLQPYMGGREWL